MKYLFLIITLLAFILLTNQLYSEDFNNDKIKYAKYKQLEFGLGLNLIKQTLSFDNSSSPEYITQDPIELKNERFSISFEGSFFIYDNISLGIGLDYIKFNNEGNSDTIKNFKEIYKGNEIVYYLFPRLFLPLDLKIIPYVTGFLGYMERNNRTEGERDLSGMAYGGGIGFKAPVGHALIGIEAFLRKYKTSKDAEEDIDNYHVDILRTGIKFSISFFI